MASKKEKETGFKEQFGALKNLPRFFQMIWETHRGMTIANVLLRIINGILPLAMLYIGKEIIDGVIASIGNESADLKSLWTLVGIELALATFSTIFGRAITLLDSLLGDLYSNKTSEQLIKHAATLDLYQFEDSEFYDKLERARRQTTSRTVLMSMVLEQFQDTITILSLGAGLLIFNPWLILLLIVALIPSFIGETHFNQRTYSLTRSFTPERRELDYLRYIGASDETAKEVKIFGLADFLANRFKAIADKYYKANQSIAIKRAAVGSILTGLGTASYYVAYVFIIYQTIQALITVGTLTFLAGSFNRMRNMLQGILNRFSRIADSALYLQDLFDFFELKPNIGSGKLKIPRPITKGFTFENVAFKYPQSEKYALKGLNFHLGIGEKIALVGENGAGKTTLVKLLARLYEPSEGRILLDGKDLGEYDLADLRAQIGIIFQDFIRFQMKASENIAIGDIERLAEEEEIIASAEKSLADPVIRELPAQYEQILGKRFSSGVDLSGGQWQKIALGRAYMRDAQLLILDEPTAALDARAEHEVFIRFSELIEGKSAVLISHRFSTVRMADRILFLEYGQLIEEGSHQELLALNGKYAELFNLQAQGYLS